MKALSCIITVCSILTLQNAYAAVLTPQDVSAVTSASSPSLLQQRLSLPVGAIPKATAPIANATEKKESPIPNAAKIHFKLAKVVIKGNTVFPSSELENIFKNAYQKNISLAELEALVDQVTVKYRSAGYIISRAYLPPQTIAKGIVNVQVVEGFISDVKIEGNAGKSSVLLKKYADEIMKSKPLKIATLERYMLLANDLPGLSVKAVLNPSKSTPAGADLSLVTSINRVNAYVSYDNYGTRYLGPQEVGAGITLNSVLIPGASETLRQMMVPKKNEMHFTEFNHTQTIGANGTRFILDGSYTQTIPGFVLNPLNIVGRSSIFYGDLAYPLIRSRDTNVYIHGTGNYENVTSKILGGLFYNDLIRSLVAGVRFNHLDRLKGYNAGSLDLEKGFKVWGAEQHLNQSRLLGVPDFTKLNLNLSRLQGLPWNLSLLAAMQWQYSCNTLLATEQYSYGGPIWGRGYDPSEIVGDNGLAGTLEARLDTYPQKHWLNTVQYYVFYDAGEIWNRDGVNLPPKQSATSTGLGARFTFLPQLTANLFIAKPLTHSVATQVILNRNPNTPRIFFQLVMSV